MRNSQPVWKQVISAVLISSLFWTHVVGAADVVQETAREGEAFAEDLLKDWPGLNGNSDGSYSFGPDIKLQPGEVFPDTTGAPDTDYGELYGDSDEALVGAGVRIKNSYRSSDSMAGEAYRLLDDSVKRDHPDLTDDPLWQFTDQTMAELEGTMGQEFADCTTKTSVTGSSITRRIPDYRTCEVVRDDSAYGTIYHTYKPTGLRVIEAPGVRSEPCEGEANCIAITLGNADGSWVLSDGISNSNNKECGFHALELNVNIEKTGFITQVVLDEGAADDISRVFINGDQIAVSPAPMFPLITDWDILDPKVEIYTIEEIFDEFFARDDLQPHPDGGESLSSPGMVCEMDDRRPLFEAPVDLTSYFQTTGLKTIRQEILVGDRGSAYFRIKIYYDPSAEDGLIEESWYPPELIDAANAIADGACRGTVQCMRQPVNPDGSVADCVVIDGVRICRDHLQDPPIDIDPMCQQVEVNAACDFYKGAMECYVDHAGIERCPSNDNPPVNSCQQYEENPECGFISTTCLEGARGESGECYIEEQVWDCGKDVEIETAETNTEYECAGPIRCMGNDCVSDHSETSPDFATAAAALQAAQFLQIDASCIDGQECTLFPGTAMECKKAVGGWQNCCESPGGVDMGDYLRLLVAINHTGAGAAIMNNLGSVGTAIQGAWNAIAEPVSNAWSTVTDWFTSAYESVMGTGAEVVTEETAKTFGQSMMESTAKWMAETFGDEAAQVIFDGAVNEAGEFVPTGEFSPGMQAIGNVMSGIMMAYMIYQIADILVQIIYECTEQEFELGQKKELKACHHVGSYCYDESAVGCVEKREVYCCYNSPLSRIINEQGIPQLGMSFGDSVSSLEDAQCGGFTMEQIAELDWNRIDFGEWTGILADEGFLPSPEEAIEALSMENVTGDGSSLNIDGTDRLNSAERNRERVEATDPEKTREDVRQRIWDGEDSTGNDP